MSSLDEQIEERRDQAKDGRISEKAAVVARHLGSYDSWDRPGEKGHKSLYEGDNLKIEDSSFFEDYGDGGVAGSDLGIIYKGKVVFLEGGLTVSSYIPGPWEAILFKLYNRAKLIAYEERTARKKGESGDQERSRWGL